MENSKLLASKKETFNCKVTKLRKNRKSSSKSSRRENTVKSRVHCSGIRALEVGHCKDRQNKKLPRTGKNGFSKLKG